MGVAEGRGVSEADGVTVRVGLVVGVAVSVEPGGTSVEVGVAED